MTLKQASRLTLNNKNDVVCWDAACNKKIPIWKGCLGKNGFGKVPSPVLKLFLGTFTATLAPPRIQMSKHSKLFGWYGTMQRKQEKGSIHLSMAFAAAIQTCVVYSFTPPIFTHETSVWLWYLTYQSVMILNLVPCNIVLRKLSQNHLVDKYNRNLNFTHAFSRIQLKLKVSITTLKPTGFHTSHQDFQSNNMPETNWNQTTQLRKYWSYHLSPLGQPAWSEDSAWIHC